MRVPLAKVYRAFPELDRFNDVQCEAYVALSLRERWAERVLMIAFNGVILVIGVPVLASVGVGVVDGLRRGNDLGAFGVVFSLSIPLPSLAALLLRDRWLRSAIARHLRGAHCPACRYLLLGLPVRDGAVTCPECGDRIELAAIGLTPADLLAPPAAAAAGS